MAQEVRPYPPPVAMPPPLTSSQAASSSPSSSQSSGQKRKQEHSSRASRKSSRRSSRTNMREEESDIIERESDTFSETTKRHVERESGGQCFHCGAVPVEICHVIPRRDSAYNELHQQGFLGFRLHESCNAVSLCPTCHANFDDTNNPGFVFLPAELDYFIEYEHNDWERRRDLMKAGVRNGGVRKCPGPEEYAERGGSYLCYTLRDFLGQYHTIRKGHVREVQWPGAPAASLRRTFGLFAHFHLMDMLPANIENQLKHLFELYRRRMTEVAVRTEAEDDEIAQPVVSKSAEGEPAPGQSRTAALLDNSRSPDLHARNPAGHRKIMESVESLPSLHPTMTTFLSSSEAGNRCMLVKTTRWTLPDTSWSWGPGKSTAENINLYIASLQDV